MRLIPPSYVKPYVKRQKNDAADAEAICEAVGRPSMRFVPIKTGEQQAVLSIHRAREGFVKARTAQANQIRGLLAEYGIVSFLRGLATSPGTCRTAWKTPKMSCQGCSANSCSAWAST